MGSNLEAIYDKKIEKRLLPKEYLPDDYTGPNNGNLKDLIRKFKFSSGGSRISRRGRAPVSRVWTSDVGVFQ